MKDVKRIDIKEFREEGYLHELNRLFLHPLGLALEVVVEEDGSEHLGGVWDYRDDPEGMIYGEDTLSPQKADRIAQISGERFHPRQASLGYWVQPVVPYFNDTAIETEEEV